MSSENAGTIRTRLRCSHCNGPMELVTPRGAQEYRRCTACGRDDRATSNAGGSTEIKPSSGRPCPTKGCVGMLDAAGKCVCCERRAAFREKHVARRQCAICEGTLPLETAAQRRYCEACKPLAKFAPLRMGKAKRSEGKA